MLFIRPKGEDRLYEQDVVTHRTVGAMLAEVKGWELGDLVEKTRSLEEHDFFVPLGTLLADEAADLGITGAGDLFGGVVPYPFMKTKALTHGLVGRSAARPPGWSDTFSAAVAGAVLPGFTAFASDDALTAVRRLLTDGPVRVKPARAAGVRAHRIARTLADADEALARLFESELASDGVVVEPDLLHVLTLSVGRVTFDRQTISYVGTQSETRDNHGRPVYGGSDLTAVRGDWEALARLDLGPGTRHAVACAVTYDVAAERVPGFFASRRNYDVVIGSDRRRRRHVGVVQASWRVGRASPGEVTALRELAHDPGLAAARVSIVEQYGEHLEVPADALVHYQGTDAVAGPVLRYTRVAGRQAA